MKRSYYRKQGAHLLEPWRNVQLFGKAEWHRQHPKRYMLMIREALRRMNVRYWEQVTVWNENHHPLFKGKPCAAGFQLLDFVVAVQRKPFVVLVHNPKSIIKSEEKARWQAKLDLLSERKIPYVIVPVHYTSQEYQIIIFRAMKGHKL